MKKNMKKNSKGFTLVELLAVIVVLAVIMVIATTQINKTIKKSRADSFVSSYNIVFDAVKMCSIQAMNDTDCKGTIDLSSDDYSLTLTSARGVYSITLEGKGKFDTMDLTEYYQAANGTDTGKTKLKAATAVSAKKIEASYTPAS